MKIIARRMIVIGAIAISGAATGVALGDFAARPGPGRAPAVDETVTARFDDPLDPVAVARPAMAASAGPTSYHCEGCDAGLHDDLVTEDAASFADVEPLPLYRPEAGMVPEPPVRQEAAVVAPPVQVPGIMLSGVEGTPRLMATPGD